MYVIYITILNTAGSTPRSLSFLYSTILIEQMQMFYSYCCLISNLRVLQSCFFYVSVRKVLGHLLCGLSCEYLFSLPPLNLNLHLLHGQVSGL